MQRPIPQSKKQPLGQTIKKFFDRKVEKKVGGCLKACSSLVCTHLNNFLMKHVSHMQASKPREAPGVIDLCDKEDGRLYRPPVCSQSHHLHLANATTAIVMRVRNVTAYVVLADSAITGANVPRDSGRSRSPSPYSARAASTNSTPLPSPAHVVGFDRD